ncbi:MAG: hypothetical protein M9895_01075 [Aquamicrobium sp.]|uniref:hypothetical protein n=1 Tax=Aquamicrobium sp. TaxID=1872579 RepID=UPI00349E91A8|nr:hypothetical protein [Aquamicrobium sp.]MCO5159185.1 hypothetical protein [Aquamicrobium sp.]
MLETVGRMIGGMFGRRSSLSVPILDGAFKPNNLLEEAQIVLERPGLEDIALGADGRLLAAAGNAVLLVGDGKAEKLESHDGAITALTVLKDGRRAVALGDRVVIEGVAAPVTEAAGRRFKAITALAPAESGGLLVCDASSKYSGDAWQHDLMTKGRGGRVLALDPASGKAELLQDNLAWASGAMQGRDGVLVSESWRHRLRLAGRSGSGGDATAELPGYPARITPTADGGFWLSLFSGRAQIVEFVLGEHSFRREMMATVDPKYWISPALSSGEDFYEPLQSGGVKHMGILKPWAPPRSYGLAVRFDAARTPLMSVHSRVGGRNHGIVTTLERGGEVFALSKGAGRLLRLDLQAIRAANGIGGSAQ